MGHKEEAERESKGRRREREEGRGKREEGRGKRERRTRLLFGSSNSQGCVALFIPFFSSFIFLPFFALLPLSLSTISSFYCLSYPFLRMITNLRNDSTSTTQEP